VSGEDYESDGKTLFDRDLLKLGDLTSDELNTLLDSAEEIKAQLKAGTLAPSLANKRIGIIMQKPSLRTLVSFEVACGALGAQPVVLAGKDSAFSRGESVKDTVMTLERYLDALVIRTFDDAVLEEVAHHASIPVINALTDGYHPCQGLADLLTIREHFGKLKGLELAFIGDGSNNMAHTYLEAGALEGMHVRIGAPVDYQPDPAVVAAAREIAKHTAATIQITTDPVAAIDGAQIVITDTWTSMGQEDDHDLRLDDLEAYQINPDLMQHAADDAIFMHCLPAHRGEEVVDEVIDAPYSRVYDEAENRWYVQAALLRSVLTE